MMISARKALTGIAVTGFVFAVAMPLQVDFNSFSLDQVTAAGAGGTTGEGGAGGHDGNGGGGGRSGNSDGGVSSNSHGGHGDAGADNGDNNS